MEEAKSGLLAKLENSETIARQLNASIEAQYQRRVKVCV